MEGDDFEAWIYYHSKNALMEELKLIKVVDWATAAKLEKQDLKKVKGGTLPCGCGCIAFNGLDNTGESANQKHG